LRLAGLGLLLWLPQIVQAISLAAARSANDEVKIALAAAEDPRRKRSPTDGLIITNVGSAGLSPQIAAEHDRRVGTS
jgi:hypothetical protein